MSLLQFALEFFLCRHHQRAMKWRRYGKNGGAFCARLRSQLHGAFNGISVTRNYRLIGRIQIRRSANLSLAARLQTSLTTAGESPMIAAIAPFPAGTASCI